MWLLHAHLAWAAPQLVLPPDQDPALWAAAAELAGLGAGGPEEGVVELVAGPSAWRVVARRAEAERSAAVPPPTTPEAREDALLLGRSLLRALDLPRPTWTVAVEGGLVGVSPRRQGRVGVGPELELRARGDGWDVALLAQGLAPRALRAGGDEWWQVTSAWAGLGRATEGTTRARVDARLGLSLRAYGEPDTPTQLDPKPLAGLGAGVEHDLGPRWYVVGAAGISVDLGPTRIEAEDAAYALGLWEAGLRVGVGARAR